MKGNISSGSPPARLQDSRGGIGIREPIGASRKPVTMPIYHVLDIPKAMMNSSHLIPMPRLEKPDADDAPANPPLELAMISKKTWQINCLIYIFLISLGLTRCAL